MSGRLLDDDVIDASQEPVKTLGQRKSAEAHRHGIAEGVGAANLKTGLPGDLAKHVGERRLVGNAPVFL